MQILPMKKGWKRKWVKALKSGDYEQGKERLMSKRGGDTAKFCCLGVLCSLVNKESKKGVYYRNGTPNNSVTEELPVFVAEKVRLIAKQTDPDDAVFEVNPIVSITRSFAKKHDVSKVGIGNYSLTYLNDAGVPFPTIAALIDEQL